MEIGTAERLTAAASYDLLRRLTEKGVISKEKFTKLCSLLDNCQVCVSARTHNGSFLEFEIKSSQTKEREQ